MFRSTPSICAIVVGRFNLRRRFALSLRDVSIYTVDLRYRCGAFSIYTVAAIYLVRVSSRSYRTVQGPNTKGVSAGVAHSVWAGVPAAAEPDCHRHGADLAVGAGGGGGDADADWRARYQGGDGARGGR
eukprot:9335019-Pyramimonas_sp.AAC.1